MRNSPQTTFQKGKETMSENTIKIVRRTHTADNLTIRESAIMLFLTAKAAKSEEPANYERDGAAFERAFGEIGRYAIRCIQEARTNLVTLKELASAGDESAEKQAKQAEKALEDIAKQQRAGKLDALLRAAKVRKI